jgi:hypothetical protein
MTSVTVLINRFADCRAVGVRRTQTMVRKTIAAPCERTFARSRLPSTGIPPLPHHAILGA